MAWYPTIAIDELFLPYFVLPLDADHKIIIIFILPL